VTIILPKVGKVVVPVTYAAAERERGDRRLLEIFNCVLEADNLARQNAWKGAKAHVELSDDEVSIVEAIAAKGCQRYRRRTNYRSARPINPSTRPAA
jgi:hypothetical protein